MKWINRNTLACLLVSLIVSSGAYAQDDDSPGPAADAIDRLGSGVADFISARNPLNGVVDGVNDFARTAAGITTVKGEFDTTVDVTGDILQTIEGGTGNLNKLDIGAVSGGSYVDGKFTSIVEVAGVSQTISGTNSVNRASIGSVSK